MHSSYVLYILFLQDLIDLTFVYLSVVGSGSPSDTPDGEAFFKKLEAGYYEWGAGDVA